MFTLKWSVLAPIRQFNWVGLVFTHKDGYFGAISGTAGSCALCSRRMFKHSLKCHLSAQNYGIRRLHWMNGISASTHDASAWRPLQLLYFNLFTLRALRCSVLKNSFKRVRAFQTELELGIVLRRGEN